MAPTESMAEQLAIVGRQLAELGLIAGRDGNLSVRLDHDRIMITPSGLAKGRLSPQDMVIVDNSGKLLEGVHRVSSEVAMHLACYRARPDIHACVHAHPPYATAFAITGVPLEEGVLPEVIVLVGPIAMTAYAPAGTPAVGESLLPFIATHNAFLLKNHGALTLGRTLDEAHQRMETVEHYARIVCTARPLGRIDHLPQDELVRLQTLRRNLRFEPMPPEA